MKKDGIDGFKYNKNKANFFTLAFNAPVIVRNKEMLYLDCDRMPVGKSEHTNDFSLFSTELKKGDWLYAFSDGFSDQFGGKTKKRLKKKAFYALLVDISSFWGMQQKRKLSEFLNDWMEKKEQVDDILIVGIKA